MPGTSALPVSIISLNYASNICSNIPYLLTIKFCITLILKVKQDKTHQFSLYKIGKLRLNKVIHS